ncbi:MAG: glutamine amidotransferase [Patescibacteria group bacterium]
MIKIVHLYPKEMNIYGDTGNRLVLEKRLEWRGIPYEVVLVGIGDSLPHDASIIIGGGGQDAGQGLVESDLKNKAVTLKNMAEDGVVMLMICGMYQLLGDAFITSADVTIKGAGVLPMFTQAGDKRFIGNTIVKTPFGELVGYENHSGRTYLEDGCLPLGIVKKGAGNNGEDKTEGARLHNVFGSYMHGPMLSKNPHFADELLKLALGKDTLEPLNDNLETMAHNLAAKRPR